ncbi:MAG: sugar phosphate isomerase/epimerase family protein, partial [Planctomycetota bacterium]
MLRFAYNTNGLAHHRLEDALRLVADLGYAGLAVTPDVGQLDPQRASRSEIEGVRRLAEELGLALSVETGARFVLDPRRKHYPTLLEHAPEAREVRLNFLRWAVDLGADLGAEAVSFWSGSGPADAADEDLWSRLVDGTRALLEHAQERAVTLGFEPEPGMFVERPAGFDALRNRLSSDGAGLGLTLDVGHCLCTGDLPVPEIIERYAADLVQVQLDDIRDGVHEHRMFGEGDLDLPGVLGALQAAGY